MPNHKSAIKRMGQNKKRRERNRTYITRTRNFVKSARVALATGDVSEAEAKVREAIRDLDKAASRGIIHKRNAARRKGRLMQQLAALSAK
ncbi:MAG: 30S ribosomal protein S20 [Phototrophicaceae bacterium]